MGKKCNMIAELSKMLNQITEVKDAQAAVVVLLKKTNKEILALFVKRAEKPTDPWSGQTALPGGKRDPKDQNMKATIVRETLEETGINLLEGYRFLGVMNPLNSIQKPDMKILPFIVLQDKEEEIKLNEELSGYFWIPLKDLVKHKGVIKNSFGKHPAYIIEKCVIWGLTYRIIKKLLFLLKVIEQKNQ